MGFIESYRRLTKRQKIGIGVFGIAISLIGPFYSDFLLNFFEESQRKDEQLKINMKSAEQERKEEAKRQFQLLKDKYNQKQSSES